jgi:hypothetical protein
MCAHGPERPLASAHLVQTPTTPNSRWRSPMGVPSRSAKPNCRNSMGAHPVQQLLPPGGIGAGARPAIRMPSPATRSTQMPLPLSGDDATGGAVPLPPGALRSARLLYLWYADGPRRSSGGAGCGGRAGAPGHGRGDEPGSEAEGRRSLDSRGLNRGVRRCRCHAAMQLPRPGWLVAERTGIRQHAFQAACGLPQSGRGGLGRLRVRVVSLLA